MPKPSVTENLSLTKASDIFKSTTKKMNGEIIVDILITELCPPEHHPFHVKDDEAMTRLAKNIKQYDILEPGLVRPRSDGKYELLCGNRRKRACEIIGRLSMPVIIRDLDNDNAILAMVDSNLEQREKILPSEKAWAYKLKMETLNHNGVKSDMHSVDALVKQTGESKNQIYRLIRLTELIQALLDKVDLKQLSFNPAVELSYLSHIEQETVTTAMEEYEIKPSLSQAVRLKKMKLDGKLTLEIIEKTLAEEKKNPKKETEGGKRYSQFFPKDYTQAQIDAIITKLLTDWNARVIAAPLTS